MVGERIKARRKKLGLKVEKIAKRLGISMPTYYRWESGDIKEVGILKFIELCKIFETTPNELLMGIADESNDWRMGR